MMNHANQNQSGSPVSERAKRFKDVTVNPAQVLRAQGANPRARGREKVELTLLWLATFIRSTEAIVLDYLGIQSRGWMRSLEKKGLIAYQETGLRSGLVWHLTPKGLKMAQGLFENEFYYYPARPDRMSELFLRHDLSVQKTAVDLLKLDEEGFNDNNIISYKNGICLYDGLIKEEQGYWIPDAIFETDYFAENSDGSTYAPLIGLEMELTLKDGIELEKKLNTIILYINTHPNTEIWWYSHLSGIQKYKQLMIDGVQKWEYHRHASNDRERWKKIAEKKIMLTNPEKVRTVLLKENPKLKL